MVFVLRRHIGEYDPDHPVADDEEDGSERQGFVAQPLPAPGLKTHSGEKSNHHSNRDFADVNTDAFTLAPVLDSSLMRWC